MNTSMNLNIGKRLSLGFAAIAGILLIAVATTIWKISAIDNAGQRIVNLRMPTAAASAQMVSNIQASLASLRGYMITGAPKFKKGRAEVWANIDKTIAEMDELSKNWTNPKNVENLQVFKGVLKEFRVAQQKVEDVAKTIDEQPATKMLTTEAAPRAGVMIKSISKMIDAELSYVAPSTTKTEVVTRLRGVLGYGGMIHQFKNYVLRQDAPRIKKVETKIGAALKAIESYRKLGVNKAEEKALADIGGVVNAYAKGA